jgi:hypothetical protein
MEYTCISIFKDIQEESLHNLCLRNAPQYILWRIYIYMYSDVNLNENSLFEVLPFGCIKL